MGTFIRSDVFLDILAFLCRFLVCLCCCSSNQRMCTCSLASFRYGYQHASPVHRFHVHRTYCHAMETRLQHLRVTSLSLEIKDPGVVHNQQPGTDDINLRCIRASHKIICEPWRAKVDLPPLIAPPLSVKMWIFKVTVAMQMQVQDEAKD